MLFSSGKKKQFIKYICELEKLKEFCSEKNYIRQNILDFWSNMCWISNLFFYFWIILSPPNTFFLAKAFVVCIRDRSAPYHFCTSVWRFFFFFSFFGKQPSRIPTPYCPQHLEVWFLRVLDKFSFGSFYWNYFRMPPIITLLLGRAPMVSSSSLIPMKWQEDGGNENPNPTWIMINSAEHWGKWIDK